MNQSFFCYLIAKPKNEVQFWFLALEGESKLLQITNSKNLNRNSFGLIVSISCANNTLSIVV